MKTKIAPEKMLRWGLQGALVLVVIVAAYSATLHSRIDELQGAIEQEKKATSDTAAASKKISDELRALKAKAAEAEARLAESDALKGALARVQPQVTAALEAAAKAGKPDVRAGLLAGAGVIGQIAGGAKNEAAAAILDRALALDKTNCAAGLASNAAGKKVELAADCQPAVAAAPVAAPAAPTTAAPTTAAPAAKN
jgi:hypothetical protein